MSSRSMDMLLFIRLNPFRSNRTICCETPSGHLSKFRSIMYATYRTYSDTSYSEGLHSSALTKMMGRPSLACPAHRQHPLGSARGMSPGLILAGLTFVRNSSVLLAAAKAVSTSKDFARENLSELPPRTNSSIASKLSVSDGTKARTLSLSSSTARCSAAVSKGFAGGSSICGGPRVLVGSQSSTFAVTRHAPSSTYSPHAIESSALLLPSRFLAKIHARKSIDEKVHTSRGRASSTLVLAVGC
mmetsp:Transcript_33293/g.88079  ORF Transcript_33293/g.88079 Transcript_33293/m.88079 type:complete len:244 (+) Transcript_33293:466-1197(+)